MLAGREARGCFHVIGKPANAEYDRLRGLFGAKPCATLDAAFAKRESQPQNAGQQLPFLVVPAWRKRKIKNEFAGRLLGRLLRISLANTVQASRGQQNAAQRWLAKRGSSFRASQCLEDCDGNAGNLRGAAGMRISSPGRRTQPRLRGGLHSAVSRQARAP